jgi:DNA helicase HerA-like ATPase
MLFDFTKRLSARASIPFHILLEESHRYVQADGDKFLLGYNIFERVAKEGRKYGLIFNLISQRPVEISDTVISQCSNFLIFKMNHPRDLEYIEKMLPNISKEVVEKQKTLQPGTCVAFGKAFKIPMIVKMEKPNPEPYSSNCDVFNVWQVKR